MMMNVKGIPNAWTAWTVGQLGWWCISPLRRASGRGNQPEPNSIGSQIPHVSTSHWWLNVLRARASAFAWAECNPGPPFGTLVALEGFEMSHAATRHVFNPSMGST